MVPVPFLLRTLPPDAASLIAAAGDNVDPSSALVQYGVLGVIVAALGPFAWSAYRWQVARGDRLEARLEERDKVIQTQVIPALLDSTAAIRDLGKVTERVAQLCADRARER